MILFKNADVFAPKPLGIQDVLVGGGDILAVGTALAPGPSHWPVEFVDLAGARLVPGLVDVHAHITGGGGEGGAQTRVPAVPVSTFAVAGVTTVIGLLGTDASTRSIPELLAAARALEHHGLTAFCYTGSYQLPPPTLTGSVRGDIVHVDRIVAVGELAISDHRSSQPTFHELARVVADAHVAGLMTGKAGLVHLHLGDGPRELALVRQVLDETELPVRSLHPTHLNRNPELWSAAIRLGREYGCWVDVTAFPEDDDAMSASEAVERWLHADLEPDRITVSSDGGGCLPVFGEDGLLQSMEVGRPDGLLRTIRELTEMGVTLSTALAAVTSTPADLFRLRGKGRIAAGAHADLVVLDDSLGAHDVLASGRWMVRGGDPVSRGLFESG